MSAWVREAGTAAFFFKRQLWHLLALLLLLPVSWSFAAGALEGAAWLGVRDSAWYWLAIGVAVLHQVLVWLGWRGQLGWAVLTRLFGRADLIVWGALFLPLLVGRPLLILCLAMADRGSLALPVSLSLGLGVTLLVPSMYTLWSVARYFGIPRAVGGDHFRSKYRDMPLVTEGAFQWSGNAMYAFGFLGLWSIAFLLGSQAALSVALFQHAYIWVHQFCTEEPDAALIYGTR